jgi:hypothetical protein
MTNPDVLEYEPPTRKQTPTILQSLSFAITGTLIGGLLTFPAMLLAVRSVGDHHPGELTANLLYPFSMLAAGLNSPPHISSDAVALAIVQFPLYGAVIGAIFRRRHSWIGLLALICIHGMAATLCVTGVFHY